MNAPVARARVAVHLLVAAQAAERRALLARALAQRPAGAHWAVLIEGLAAGLPTLPPEVVVIPLAGCACCTGATVLRVTLVRLLRHGGLDAILIVPGAAARPAAIAAMLAAPPFDILVDLQAPLSPPPDASVHHPDQPEGH